MRVFNGYDVLQFAIRVEENGEAFYRETASMMTDNDVTELFLRLAGEEIKHKSTFEGMLAQLKGYQPPETYDGEYLTYLQNYIDGKAIFKDHPKIPEMAKVRDRDTALDFAIQREADSILYYEELKRFAETKHASVIDGVIAEERKHFVILLAMKEKSV
jgi:rubrerythrin